MRFQQAQRWNRCFTYSPRVVQLEAQRSLHIIRLSSKMSRQPPVSIHHCVSTSIAVPFFTTIQVLLSREIHTLLNNLTSSVFIPNSLYELGRVVANVRGDTRQTYPVPLIQRTPCSLAPIHIMFDFGHSRPRKPKQLSAIPASSALISKRSPPPPVLLSSSFHDTGFLVG